MTGCVRPKADTVNRLGRLFGSAYVEEIPIDADSFSMKMELVHPLFGTLFRYQRYFSIANSSEQLP